MCPFSLHFGRRWLNELIVHVFLYEYIFFVFLALVSIGKPPCQSIHLCSCVVVDEQTPFHHKAHLQKQKTDTCNINSDSEEPSIREKNANFAVVIVVQAFHSSITIFEIICCSFPCNNIYRGRAINSVTFAICYSQNDK